MKLQWELLIGLIAFPHLVSAGSLTEEHQQSFNDDVSGNATAYPYRETLDITPLPRNHLLVSFNFSMASEYVNVTKSKTNDQFKAFPRALAPILESTNTRELHLRFGQGWWDSEEWGQLPYSGEYSGGVGVEVWSVIEAANRENAFGKWTTLVNSLSGLFCASLNFIDKSKTTYPVRSLKPENNLTLFGENNELHLVRAALASEPVCTENLTPFVKFLPGRGKSGLSSLLDGHRVFESEWHKMSIDIETECAGDLCRYVMEQKVDAVVHVPRALRAKKNAIPKPVSGNELRCDLNKPHDAFQCFPLGDSNNLDFTLSDIFHRTILGGASFAEKPTRVCTHITENWNAYLKVEGNYFGTPSNCFDITDDKVYDLYFQTEDSSKIKGLKEAPIFVSRSLTGYGQDKGDSRTVFNNPLNETVRLLYFESLPWFMRVYLHTVTISGGDAKTLVKSVYYSPEVDRERPTHIEFELIIPANSNIALSYSFDKSLLLYSEYPPDANHGFSVEPGVVNVLEPVKYSLRTSSALLTLPTPDFSMPYNVIILSSTVMALAFGTLFNLLVKRLVTEEEADLVIEVSGIKALVKKIKSAILSRLKKKNTTSKE